MRLSKKFAEMKASMSAPSALTNQPTSELLPLPSLPLIDCIECKMVEQCITPCNYCWLTQSDYSGLQRE